MVVYRRWPSLCSCLASSVWWLFISTSLMTTIRGFWSARDSIILPAPIQEEPMKGKEQRWGWAKGKGMVPDCLRRFIFKQTARIWFLAYPKHLLCPNWCSSRWSLVCLQITVTIRESKYSPGQWISLIIGLKQLHGIRIPTQRRNWFTHYNHLSNTRHNTICASQLRACIEAIRSW